MLVERLKVYKMKSMLPVHYLHFYISFILILTWSYSPGIKYKSTQTEFGIIKKPDQEQHKFNDVRS